MKYLMAAFYIGFLLSFFTTKYSIVFSATDMMVMAEDAANRFQSSHLYHQVEYYFYDLRQVVERQASLMSI